MKDAKYCLLAPLALAISGAVEAQSTTDAEEAFVLDEVVVTGTKIPGTLQDTKESVAIFTQETINALRLFDLRDVYQTAANVFDFQAGENFGIRGVTQNSASTGGGTGELGILYIDGVAFLGFANRFGPKALWDVQQVEILRGPQSTNVGRNAMIGAVVMTTNKPDPELFDAAGRLEVGNYGTVGLEAMLNAPVSDSAAFRFTAEGRDTDGHIYNATLDDDQYDARENRTARGRFLWQASDTVNVSLMAQYAETNRGTDLYRGDLNEDLEDRISFANLQAREDYEATSAALDINWQINDRWVFRSITSTLDGEYDRFDDDDEGPEGGDAFRGRQAEDDNWAQEFRFSYGSENVRGVVGVFYTEIDLINNTQGLVTLEPAFLGVPDILLPFYPATLEIDLDGKTVVETTNQAIFTQWDWDLNERWTLSAGIRYDEEEQTTFSADSTLLAPGSELPDPVEAGMIADMIQPGSGPIVAAGVAQVNAALEGLLGEEVFGPEDTKYDAWLPSFGGTYNLNEDMSISAFYTRGYRAGGIDIALTTGRFEFEPEYLDNFEIAWRSVLADGNIVFNANAYYGDWTDQQVIQCPMGQVSCRTVNAGESEIYGAEFELNWAATDSVHLFTTVGYAHTEFKDFVSDLDGDLSGNRFAFSPEWTAAVGGQWRFLQNWALGGTLSYQDEAFSDQANTITLDSRTLLNANLRYETNRFTILAYGRNLTDDFYLENDGPGLAPASRIVRAGPPREYGVMLSLFYR